MLIIIHTDYVNSLRCDNAIVVVIEQYPYAGLSKSVMLQLLSKYSAKTSV